MSCSTAGLRIGFVGAGFISQVAHLPAYAAEPRSLLVGIADNRPKLREVVADRFGIKGRVRHHRALLEDPEVEAVVISVHRRCAAPITAEALRAGKAVFSEKPMAYTLAQAEELVRLAASAERPYAVGFMRRFDPGVALCKRVLSEAIEDATLGEIVHVGFRNFCPTYAVVIPQHIRSDEPKAYRYEEWPLLPDGLDPAWQADYEYTLNVASHDLNLLRYLFGDTLAVEAFRIQPGRMQSGTLSAGRFDISLQVGRSDNGAWNQTLDIMFRKGQITLRLPSPLARQEAASVEIRRAGEIRVASVPPVERVWAFQAQASHFVSAACGETPLLSPGGDGLKDLALIEGLWKQVRSAM